MRNRKLLTDIPTTDFTVQADCCYRLYRLQNNCSNWSQKSWLSGRENMNYRFVFGQLTRDAQQTRLS